MDKIQICAIAEGIEIGVKRICVHGRTQGDQSFETEDRVVQITLSRPVGDTPIVVFVCLYKFNDA
jgi:hypothetical protein